MLKYKYNNNNNNNNCDFDIDSINSNNTYCAKVYLNSRDRENSWTEDVAGNFK